MIVFCKQCGFRYDDEFCWTICPHRYLVEPPDGPTPYCREHDLFHCPLHSGEAHGSDQAEIDKPATTH